MGRRADDMTAPGAKSAGTRPRDASMSLLNNIFAQPLEPGYERAAQRRRNESEDPHARSKNRFSPALVIGMLALGLLLTVAALQAQGQAGIASAEREGLIERIRSQESQTERLQDTVDELQAEINELEDVELRKTAEGQRVREELQRLQQAAGTLPVSGPGVSVILDDAENPEAAERPDMARVLDVDLRNVVNGLWLAGAEAISINGQRLTALSAIRIADNVIHVQNQPMRPPYHVKAIGDSQTLPHEFNEGPGGDMLRVAASYDVESFVRAEESLVLPAASMDLLYAKHPREAS
ncbi:DUF881 domain-containing protein [Actinobacteria bacterium YIM 96077]|uniref:DUF881 domain-containing protein n=1 Tax=Phytoactinopolyspora halophila TaxID=1981511 RepID=A0A329QYX8_9ACTN|nr:DUF881 domain-containing protein [Phytoactinopolyspora halophila]AYY13238.1 DUF881 domain-containing protein [Actinobacteria bacterium YIM 96077]RAW17525.1 DUF881 domain-containing protein [Phytoactinopolyspora halophila]